MGCSSEVIATLIIYLFINQLEERLLKTAKEKMEQLSKAYIGSECEPYIQHCVFLDILFI